MHLFHDITQFAACMSSMCVSSSGPPVAKAAPGILEPYSPFTNGSWSRADARILSCGLKLGDTLLITFDFSCSCLFISSNSFRKLLSQRKHQKTQLLQKTMSNLVYLACNKLPMRKNFFLALGAGYMHFLGVLIGSLRRLYKLWLASVITLLLVLRHSVAD